MTDERDATGLETSLHAFLSADAPPARDPAFTLAVMARIERRQFHRALAVHVALAAFAALLLALVMPVLQDALRHADIAAMLGAAGWPVLIGAALSAGMVVPYWLARDS